MTLGLQCVAILAVAVAATAATPSSPGLARSMNFEVYAQGGPADAKAILLGFERLHAYFEDQTGLRLEQAQRVRVIAFRSREEYEAYRLGPSADAYYVSSEDRDTIVMTAPAAGDIRVAAHEYAHVVLRASNLSLPPWLSEGLPEVFSLVRLNVRGARSQRELPAHSKWLRSHAWMPLGDLVRLPADSPLREQRETVDLYYAESWALTDMLAASPVYGSRFAKLVAALSSGAPSDQALMQTYGKPLEQIESDLREWVQKRRVAPDALPELAPGGVESEAKEIPTLTWRAVLAELLAATSKLDRAKTAYEELAREAPQNAGYPAALAGIALRQGERQQAHAYWQHALDLGLQDANACFRYAVLADEAGSMAADYRAALERAVAVQPDFDNAHYLLAHLDNNASRYESAVAHLRAMRAVGAARQFGYWTALSYALDELGRHDEARAAALQAREHAATSEERERAAQLARIAETDLSVRFTRDANGNSHLVTTRVPRDEPGWNPFIEPDDLIRQVDGKLQTVNCDGEAPSVVVETPDRLITLLIPDASRVQIRNSSGEFTCGPQPGNTVTVVYAAREARNSDGIVRGIEFR